MLKDDNKAVDEFMQGLNGESSDPFSPADEDPFNLNKEEKKEEGTKEDTEEEEKPLPFHKDPKVQKYVEKQIKKALDEVKVTPTKSETQQFIEAAKGGDEDDLLEVLTEIIGNDTPEKVAAAKRFKKAIESRTSQAEERGAQKALSKWQEEEQSKRDADAKAEEELNSGFESIEEEYGVDLSSTKGSARKLRAEFVEYVKKVAPKNDHGEIKEFPDFLGAFESFQEIKKASANQQPNRQKELAARGLSRSADASNAPVSTDKSWKAVDRLFSKLDS